MKTLLCKIGTQGLADGRCIPRGDTYEVDDNTASALVAANYAEYVIDPVVADVVESGVESDVVDADVVAEDVLDEDVLDENVVDDEVVETESDEDAASVAEDAMAMAESVEPPTKAKRTYKRRT